MIKESETAKTVSGRIDELRQEMIDFQVKLTAIPALGPENSGTGEWARAKFLEEYIKKHRIGDVEHIDAPDERVPEGTRPNLLVKLAGGQRKPTVWVMAHMDIVPAGDPELWQTPPHQAVVKDGRIYGRGTEDNQQGLASALFAMRALRELGLKPPSDVVLMLVSDEETGSSRGIEYVLEKRAELFHPGDLVVVPDAGDASGSMLEVAEKSILWVKLEVVGRQVHASTPQLGVNAARAAAHLVVALDKSLHDEFPETDQVFDPPGSTFEPTRHDANVPNVNTVPGKETLFFDCRLLPAYPVQSVIDKISSIASKIENIFNVKIEVSFPNVSHAAPPTQADSSVVVRLARAVREEKKVEPKLMGIGGGTVAALFRRKGIPSVVWSTLEDLAHQPNEYCIIDNMVSDAKVFARFFLDR